MCWLAASVEEMRAYRTRLEERQAMLDGAVHIVHGTLTHISAGCARVNATPEGLLLMVMMEPKHPGSMRRYRAASCPRLDLSHAFAEIAGEDTLEMLRAVETLLARRCVGIGAVPEQMREKATDPADPEAMRRRMSDSAPILAEIAAASRGSGDGPLEFARQMFAERARLSLEIAAEEEVVERDEDMVVDALERAEILRSILMK